MADTPAQQSTARAIIRRAVKRVCSEFPCNHINCNRSAAGCVNEPSAPVTAALVDAFRAAGQPEWADAILAAGAAIEEAASHE